MTDQTNTVETTTKPSFSLSKANKIYLLVIIILVAIGNTLVVMRLVGSGTVPQEAIAEMTGELIFSITLSFIFIPGFFAYLVWWLRGRKEKAGTLTFNIVITIVLLLKFLGSIATTTS